MEEDMKKVALFAASLLLFACGQQESTPKPSKNIDSQVINGDLSELGARPYQIVLLKNGRHYCGGTIISKRWILTAAHCISDKNASIISIRAGSLDSGSGGQVIKAKQVIPHPGFGKGGMGADIGVVELASDLQFNENVSAAAIPTKALDAEAAAPGQTLTLSGWGRYDGNSKKPSKKLREAPLKVMTQEACGREFKTKIDDGMICGQVNEKKQTGCNGDSGGPFARKVDGKFVVFGAVSWGGGGKCTSSVVFARAGYYQEWITKNSGVQPGGGTETPSDGKTYTGTVKANQSQFQPNSKGFEWAGGTLAAKLSSPVQGGDFDLYLQKKEGVRWVDVGSSNNEGHNENISYNAAVGTYRWEVYAYEGSGDYTIQQLK